MPLACTAGLRALTYFVRVMDVRHHLQHHMQHRAPPRLRIVIGGVRAGNECCAVRVSIHTHETMDLMQ